MASERDAAWRDGDGDGAAGEVARCFSAARRAEEKGDFDRALRHYDRALGFEPGDPVIHYLRSHALEQLDRIDEALAALDDAIAGGPDQPDFLNAKGCLLQDKLADHGQAADLHRRAIALDEDDPAGWFSLGDALLGMGLWADAADAHMRAWEINPEDYEALLNVGCAYQEMCRHDDALDVFELALEIAPEDPELHVCRGNALEDLGRLDDALEAYDTALSIDPEDMHAWINKGYALEALEEPERALDAYGAAAAVAPEDHRAWFNQGNVLSELERWEDAVHAYGQAHVRAPHEGDVLFNWGQVLRRLKRREDALDVFDRYLELDPVDLRATEHRALLLDELGRDAEAAEAWARADRLRRLQP